MAAAPDPATWGSCRFCGVAVRPGSAHCAICGADRPVVAGTMPGEPRSVRRRVRWTSALRALIVVGVVIGLAYTIIDAEFTGPPVVADPLTTAGVHSIPIGSAYVLTGNITGGDYVVGNYSTIDPSGLSVTVAVYNESEWSKLGSAGGAAPSWSSPAQPTGRIIFTAQYTDQYYFVFSNPYPASSRLNVTVYVTTQYESNVGDEGLG
jgi:hypothetical protein